MTSDVQARPDNLIAVTAIFGDDTAVTELADFLMRLERIWEFSMACARLRNRDLVERARAARGDNELDLDVAVAINALRDDDHVDYGRSLVSQGERRFSAVRSFVRTPAGGRARLAMRRVQMNSPLELDLVGLCQTVPGEVALGVLLFERLVRLAMRWQRQQEELRLRRESQRRAWPYASSAPGLAEEQGASEAEKEEEVVAAVPPEALDGLDRIVYGSDMRVGIGRQGAELVSGLMKYRLVRRE